jgi:hypothetical protein
MVWMRNALIARLRSAASARLDALVLAVWDKAMAGSQDTRVPPEEMHLYQ